MFLFSAFHLHVICVIIQSSVSIKQSRSAFGETIRENAKATGLRLVRQTLNAVSLVECNLKCLNDQDCRSTNYFAASTGRFRGQCQLLNAHQEAELTFEPCENAVYTKLSKVSNAFQL